MATKAKIKSTKTKSASKKKFTMPHVFTLLFLIAIVVMLVTWIAPSGYYVHDEFFSAGQSEMGFINVLMAIAEGFMGGAELIFFLFAIGAFINMVMKSEVMEATIGTGLKKLKGKEIWMIPLLMLFFSFAGSIYGMNEETLAFYVILVPVFVLAGFDAMTAVFTILLGAGVGVLTSTLNPFSIGAAVDAAGVDDVTLSTGMGFRWISFIVFYIAATVFVMWYAKRVENNKDLSAIDAETRKNHEKWAKANYDLTKIPKMTGARKVTIGLFFFSLFMMVVMLVPWGDLFPGLSETIPKWGKTLGEKAPWVENGTSNFLVPGSWYFLELGVFFLIMSIIIGVVNRNKEAQIYEYAVEGAKDMLGVALVIAVAKSVSVILAGTTGDISIAESTQEGIWNFKGVTGEILATSLNDGETWLAFKDVNITKETLGWLSENTVFYDNNVWFGESTINFQDFTSSLTKEVNLSNSIMNVTQPISKLPEAVYNPLVYLIYLPMSFLIPSTSGLAGASLPIMGPMANNAFGPQATATTITAFSFASGTINLITPTSGVVMGALAISKIEYGTYLKAVGKFFIGVVLLSLAMMALHTWLVF